MKYLTLNISAWNGELDTDLHDKSLVLHVLAELFNDYIINKDIDTLIEHMKDATLSRSKMRQIIVIQFADRFDHKRLKIDHKQPSTVWEFFGVYPLTTNYRVSISLSRRK